MDASVPGFPSGPYQLRGTLGASVRLGTCWLIAVASLAGSLWNFVGTALEIQHARSVWEGTGPTREATVEGKARSTKWVFWTYDLTVEYLGPDGVLRRHPLEFTTLTRAFAPRAETAIVRLAPDDPDDFALEALVAVSGPRWRALLVLTLGFVLIGAVFLHEARKERRQRRAALLSAEKGVPRWCAMTPRAAREGRLNITFEIPTGAGDVRVTRIVQQGGRPLTRPGNWVLALVPPGAPDQSVLVLDDLSPLSLSPEQRQAAYAAVSPPPQPQ
ncbi:MAG: hypothetical protein RL685_2648 [Pseudomonadota bacterium]|jgi:hypothetical protein